MNKLMRHGITLFLLGSLIGCSSSFKQVFHDNFADYTPESSVPPLQLPKNVTLPNADTYYDIPELANGKESAVGLYPPGSRQIEVAPTDKKKRKS